MKIGESNNILKYPSSKKKDVVFLSWDSSRFDYLDGIYGDYFKGVDYGKINLMVYQFLKVGSEEIPIERKTKKLPYRYIVRQLYGSKVSIILAVLRSIYEIIKIIKEKNDPVVVYRASICAAFYPILRLFVKHRAIYDCDGIYYLEKVEFEGYSLWNPAILMLGLFHGFLIKNSESILVRSKIASKIMSEKYKRSNDDFIYLSNIRNPEYFQVLERKEKIMRQAGKGLNKKSPVFGYIGSLGGKYDVDALINIMLIVKKVFGEANLMIVSQDDEYFKIFSQRLESENVDLVMTSCKSTEAPSLVALFDFGLCLIHQTESMKYVSAIKVGEYLLSGIPVISSRGIGDINEMPDDYCYKLYNHNEKSLIRAIEWADKQFNTMYQSISRSAREDSQKMFLNMKPSRALEKAFLRTSD